MRVDLGRYKKEKSRVFSGRLEGNKVRADLGLDKNDMLKKEMTIVIPDDTLSLNSSFFLGAFGPSIRNLGKEEFEEIYKFECTSFIKKSIEDGKKRAIKTSNALESR